MPILVKVQQLQRKLLMPQARPTFARAWNWVDAYLQSEYGAGTDLHRMLRQAMASRRALLLVDGIDEGGAAREEIERCAADASSPGGLRPCAEIASR